MCVFVFARTVVEGALKGMNRSTHEPQTTLDVAYSEDDYDAHWTNVTGHAKMRRFSNIMVRRFIGYLYRTHTPDGNNDTSILFVVTLFPEIHLFESRKCKNLPKCTNLRKTALKFSLLYL